MKITIISGSPRTQSITVRVAKFLQHYLNNTFNTHTFDLVVMSENELPFVDKVWSTINDAPDQFKPLVEKISSSDAFILVSPEYNGGYSTAMKNLLDHFPKQSKKVFGIVTASPGSMGGIRAAQQMQNLVCGLMGIPCPSMLIIGGVDKKFDAQAKLVDEAFANSIHTFATEFIWLAEAIKDKKSN